MQVNLPSGDFYRIQTKEAGTEFLDQLLCVTSDNNPNLGVVYPGGHTCQLYWLCCCWYVSVHGMGQSKVTSSLISVLLLVNQRA